MPVLALADVLVPLLILGLLLAYLVASAMAYQSSQQARSYSVNLPVVAGPITSALDAIRNYIVAAAQWGDTLITNLVLAQLNAMAKMIVAVVKVAQASLLFLIHDTAAKAAGAYSLALSIENAELPGLRGRLGNLESALSSASSSLAALITASVAAAVALLESQLFPVRDLSQATAQTVATYRPLWDQLAAVPGGAANTINLERQQIQVLQAQVGVLERDLANTQAGVSALERTIAGQQATLARLAALLTLAGAGAAVLEMVLQLARNPCYCLTDGDFSDLPARVDSLELNQL